MSNTKKKILFVGGSGYLGTHLGELFSSSFQVYNTSRTKKDNFILLDLLNKETYENVKQEGHFDYIFILASTMQGLGTRVLKEDYLNLDTLGLSNFIQFISDNKIGNKFIYTSSMTVYGEKNNIPVTEDGVLEPLSTYGLSKVIGEKIMGFHSNLDDAKSVILRIPGIYGGQRTLGFIYNTAKKSIKNESIEINTTSLGYWETIHIDDLCSYIKSFIENYEWKSSFNIFNISYGTKTDIVDCAFFIKDLLNSKSEIIIKGEKGYTDFYLDNSKVKKYIHIENKYIESLQQYINQISKCIL